MGLSWYASGDVIWQKSALDRVNTSRLMSYQNVGGSKVPPATPTKSLKASMLILQLTVVPQFEHLEVTALLPLSVSYEKVSKLASLKVT